MFFFCLNSWLRMKKQIQMKLGTMKIKYASYELSEGKVLMTQ